MVRAALLIALCASTLVDGRARADEQLAPEIRAARAHYHAGQAYFRQGDLKRALAEFRASARDDARPELDYNIGLTCDRLGDAVQSIEAYRRFLTARPEDPQRAELEGRIATLETSVGELVVVSRVSGATLTLDGEPLGAGRVGVPLRANAGLHEVVARKEAQLTQRRQVRVEARGRVTIAIDPRDPEHGLDRRAKLGIGLGVGGAVLLIGGVALGVYFGTRAPSPFDPGGPAGVVSVRPLALGGGR